MAPKKHKKVRFFFTIISFVCVSVITSGRKAIKALSILVIASPFMNLTHRHKIGRGADAKLMRRYIYKEDMKLLRNIQTHKLDKRPGGSPQGRYKVCSDMVTCDKDGMVVLPWKGL